MVQFWQSQVLCGRFDLIVHRLPIRGHSFLPCNREFGVIERDQRKNKMVESFTGWEEMIRERFDLTSMKGSDMRNYKEHLGHFYKKVQQKGMRSFRCQSTRSLSSQRTESTMLLCQKPCLVERVKLSDC